LKERLDFFVHERLNFRIFAFAQLLEHRVEVRFEGLGTHERSVSDVGTKERFERRAAVGRAKEILEARLLQEVRAEVAGFGQSRGVGHGQKIGDADRRIEERVDARGHGVSGSSQWPSKRDDSS
jgi:hypothetical protein